MGLGSSAHYPIQGLMPSGLPRVSLSLSGYFLRTTALTRYLNCLVQFASESQTYYGSTINFGFSL